MSDDEPTLFDDPLPHVTPRTPATHPETAHRAAKVAAINAGTHRARCLDALYLADLTDFELSDRLSIVHNSIGMRRGELVYAGYAEPARDDAGEIVTRLSPSHCAATVWRLTLTGRAVAVRLRNAATETGRLRAPPCPSPRSEPTGR